MVDETQAAPLTAQWNRKHSFTERLWRGLRGPLSALGYRLAAIVFQLFAVSIVVFVVLRLIPADPLAMMLPPNATIEDAELMRKALGLDRSIPEQFAVWLGNALQGNLGNSIQTRSSVSQLILTALPMTLELAICGMLLGIILGFTFGLVTFYFRGRFMEKTVEVWTSLVQSCPEFLWGIILILVFGLWLNAMPFIGPISSQLVVQPVTGFMLIDTAMAGRWDAFASRLSHIVLPAVAIAMVKTPLIMRLLRSSLIEVYTEDYVDSARLRGVGEMRILFRHALRNAALPAVTLIGVQAAHTFGGTLLIEAIYSVPGLGNLMITAIRTHDLPLIQGITLTYCMIVLIMNAMVDLTYLWLNPRLRAN